MRTLFLMRGCPGSGKSTFIKNNNLDKYTLSSDDIRLLFQSPVSNLEGGFSITQKNDGKVWKLLFQLLEERMNRGELTVIDATHSTTKSINAYKDLCVKYRYRCYVIDFTNVDLETVLKQNTQRDSYKKVPEDVIKMIYLRYKTEKIPSYAKEITQAEFQDVLKYKPLDLTKYKKIHFIGDIHGCMDPLNEYFSEGIKEDEFYIFVGDYTDRGVQNKEVLEWMMDIQKIDHPNNNQPKNIIWIEGNHEKYIRKYANEEDVSSYVFNNKTKTQIKDIDKKRLRKMYRKLVQVALIKYQEKEILISHGGLSFMPDNLTTIATNEFINGTGSYKDNVGEYFIKNTKNNQYCIYGHRNVMSLKTRIGERAFNLEGHVEFGGELRIVCLTADGFNTISIKNNTFDNSIIRKTQTKTLLVSEDNFVNELRNNKNIKERTFGNISSFNFTPKVFYQKLWDEQTVKARGLFININSGKIVARSYDKFFNINETENTKISNLRKDLQFPVTVYKKENGYLGILGYDEEKKELVFASKSSMEGIYAQNFKNIFMKTFNNNDIEYIEKILKKNNASMVFEVIAPSFDSHIISYDKDKLVLLDIIKRNISFKKEKYQIYKKIKEDIGCEIKEQVLKINNWSEFYLWYDEVSKDMSIEHEGFVVEDSNCFMFKIKTPYYNRWKSFRGMLDIFKKCKDINNLKLKNNSLYNEKFFLFLKTLDKELLECNIIELREKFLIYEKTI